MPTPRRICAVLTVGVCLLTGFVPAHAGTCTVDGDCDDLVSCTVDTCDTGTSTCVFTPNNALCDDGAFCNGDETCDALLDCQAGVDPCDDAVGCTDDTCDEVLDSCSNAANDANCDDGAFCNGDETCDALLDCQAGVDPCDDAVACTDDSCDEVLDACTNAANDANCDDGAFCNGDEICDPVLNCQAGADPCDDAVGCTDDSCDEVLDSCSNTANDANCGDGAFCNGSETCDALLDCQAGTDPCLPQLCEEVGDTCVDCLINADCTRRGAFCDTGTGVCVECLVDGDCDDGVGCTIDTCDSGTNLCSNTADNTACDDGAFCNGVETCDVLLDCQAGTDPCDDAVGCTDDTCDEVLDSCSNAANDANCDDGAFCNGSETCDALLDCQAGTGPCDDAVVCTDDTCDEVLDSCSNTANDANCDDGAFCNGDETCDALLDCQAGTGPCDDAVACTDDTCDEVLDSCSNTANDANCDDGAFCNGDETCDALLDCQAGTGPCDDAVACTDDTCDEVLDTCSNSVNDANCDDGAFCNGAETCDAVLDCQAAGDPCPSQACDEAGDACVACLIDADCDDGVSCTIDTCDTGTNLCNNVTDDTACDDGAFCNGVETCDALLDCQAGGDPCDDGVSCTDDTCNETLDNCSSSPNPANCDDGVFCNGVEICNIAVDCIGGSDPCGGGLCSEPLSACVDCLQDSDCNDGITCTVDVCNLATGLCAFNASDPLCDDGLFCNGSETCDAVLDCQAGTTPCDDAVACTDDTCDEALDTCSSTANDANCDDGTFCNGAETCDALLDCQVGTDPCVDAVGCTVDGCDEGADTCTNTPSDLLCDNGVFCDGPETCDALLDCQAAANPCDDGVGCTIDACDEVLTSCINTPDDTACDDGVFCTGAETCDALLDCQVGSDPCAGQLCDEGNTVCVDCLLDGDCDDGLFCNGTETCNTGVCQPGVLFDCSDGVACTIDTCDEGTDSCVSTPVDGLCDNGVFCDGAEACDAVLDCQAGTALTCDDGIGCTIDSCDEAGDTCVNTTDDTACDNGQFCDGVEVCDAALDCQPGAALTCDDGVGCTVDSCDETGDQCVNTPNDTLCDNSQFCDGSETCDALLDCQAGTAVDCSDGVACTDDVCDEITDLCINTSNDVNCDDGAFCNGAEMCDALLDCQVGVPVDCDDAVGCTTDSCDEAGDACVHTPIVGCQECTVDGDCDDGVACTIDTCGAGICVNAPENTLCNNGQFCDGDEVCDLSLGCIAGPLRDCDDDIVCTADTCDEVADECVHGPVDSACDNGQFCDGAETCNEQLGCVAGSPPCDDGVGCTENACNELTDLCIFVPIDLNCDNGQFCDGAEVCHPLTGCMPGVSPCEDSVGCTVDSCNEVIDSCTNTIVDGLCDDGDVLNGAEYCDPFFDCQDGEPLQLVEIRPVVLQNASGLNSTLGTPPGSTTDVELGQPFVVEMWAQLLVDLQAPPLEGLCCVFADVTFNDSFMTCNGAAASPEFSSFATGSCSAPGVDEVGGCTFNLDVGVTPSWVRISSITMNADQANFGNVISADPATTTVSICQFGNVPVSQIVFGSSPPFTIGTPCLYDLDFDSCITPGDLAFFAPCWLSCDTDTQWLTSNCPAADFDCSGCVDPGDLSFFATGWLRCCDDPTIIFPPTPCGLEGGQPLDPAPRDVVEGFGLPYPGDDADPRIKRAPEDRVDGSKSSEKLNPKPQRRGDRRLRERNP